MNIDLNILTAFLIGLAGAGHCFGMCGGIISALSFNTNTGIKTPKFAIQMLYHLGRITTYTLMATLLTFFFQAFSEYYQVLSYFLRYLAGIILILMGLYLINASSLILYIEKLGSYVWKYLSPKAKSVLPIRRMSHAFVAGFIWGWLPCGLVYSSLLWVSASSSSILQSSYLMLAFGIGTLPAMLATGLFTLNLKSLWNKMHLNFFSGCFMVLYGAWTLPLSETLFYSLR